MSGLISTGLDYQKNALSGFIRESELEEKRREANEQLKAQRDVQQTQEITTGASTALSLLMFAAMFTG